jgi:pimeloyl-ACP methyl ester carboxylesterase
MEGYSFDQVVEAIRASVALLVSESTNPQAKLTGIFHDWGVVAGTMYTNRTIKNQEKEGTQTPETIDQLVLLDVLCPPHRHDTKDLPVVPRDSLYHMVVLTAYRVILACSFGIQCYISKTLAKIYAGAAFAVLGLLRLGPTLDIDAKVFKERKKPLGLDRLLYMAYPYFNTCLSVWNGTLSHDFRGYHLPRDLVRTPVLYMYGTHKRVMFHDARALALLEREERKQGSRCKVVAVPGAGHWLFRHEPELCYQEVIRFILNANEESKKKV